MQRVYFTMDLWQMGEIAFRREALWESLGISAVIVDHILVLYPFQLVLAWQIKFFPHPRFNIGDEIVLGIIGVARRSSMRPNASIVGVEVPIVGREWCLAPVYLDESTSCCPVVRIPQTRIQPHWLVFWVWNTKGLPVLEFSNGDSVN